MRWADYATNRFGGRLPGSDAYLNAADWALWQFKEWGVEAHLDEVGEVPVGFNRGPWFGKMVVPGREGPLLRDPFLYRRDQRGAEGSGGDPERGSLLHSGPVTPLPRMWRRRRRPWTEAMAEVRADPSKFDGAWVLISGENSGFGRDGRRNSPEYSDSRLMPPLTKHACGGRGPGDHPEG